MRNRRWVAIAGLACVLLCAWVALAFLREAPGDANRAAEQAANASAARAGAGRAADGRDATDAARDDATKRT